MATQDGTIIPCLVSFGAPYVDTEDPRCKPRPVIVPGKGSYVKVVDRDGDTGRTVIVVGTIGIQRGKAEVHDLDTRSVTATRAPDETSDTEDKGAESNVVVDCVAKLNRAIDKG